MITLTPEDVRAWMRRYVNPRRLVPRRLTETYRRSDSVTTIVSDSGYETEILTLNAFGTELWQGSDGQRNLDELAGDVCRKLKKKSKHIVLDDLLSVARKLDQEGVMALEPGRSSLCMPGPADVLLLSTPDPIHYQPQASGVPQNSSPPLGLLYLAAALRAHGISVAVLDLNLYSADLTELRSAVEAIRPRIVGVSVLTAVSEIAKALLAIVREIDPRIITLAGGPHPTVLPEHMLGGGYVDYVVRGEGDRVLPELAAAILHGKSADGILGLSFVRNSQVVHNPNAPAIDNLDELPVPARDFVNIQDYLQQGGLVTSRGCTHNCVFCSSVLLRGHGVRVRSVPGIMDELRQMMRTGISAVEVQDDDFSSDANRMEAIARELGKAHVTWGCQCTIQALRDNPSVLRTLEETGCRQVFCGVESGGESTLREVKRITREDVRIVMRAITSAGMRAVASFIIGWPTDTQSSARETLDLALALRKYGVHTPFSILTPFPGTPLYTNPQAHGISIESRNFTDYTYSRANISTRHLSRDQLTAIYFDVISELCGTYESPVCDSLEH